jgi:hypothetical protein
MTARGPEEAAEPVARDVDHNDAARGALSIVEHDCQSQGYRPSEGPQPLPELP